jgi:cell division initiation protein
MNESRPGTSSPAAPTPDEVRTATFNQSQLAWRGYSEDEVRAYLSQLADSMVAADQERAALRVEIDRLRNFYRDHGHDVDLITNATASRRTRDSGNSLVLRVKAYADVQVERAKRYAAMMDQRAETEATEAFHHANAQAALAVEETIQRSAVNAHGHQVLDPGELDRASLWLRAFFHALQAQLQVTNDLLTKAAEKHAASAQTRRR